MRRTLGRSLLLALLGLTLVSCQSGSSIVELHVPDDPTVTFKVWVRAGSQDDPPGKAGLAHLTGQMISEGATTVNSYQEILSKLYPLASGYGIRVDREMTVLTGRTHRDNLERFFELFSDAYLKPAFNEDDFERLRTDTLNYLKNTLRYDSDEELGKATLYSFVFGDGSYAHPPEGTVGGLESITLDDVRTFYQRHYSAPNVQLAIGGGFEEALVQRFQATMEALPASPEEGVATSPEPEAVDFEGRLVRLVAKPDADASISFGFPIDVHRGEREFYALWVANSWLGEHRNSASHLYQVIREARGMNYGDYSYIEAFPGGGRRNVPPTHVGRRQQLFEVWIRTLPNDQAVFALRAALREVQQLIDKGMSAEEFELTRSFLKKYILHFADTTQARLGYALDDRFYNIDEPGHLARFRKTLDELSVEDVNAAIRKHLQLDRVKIAIVTGDADGLRTALGSGEPTPMTYGSPKPEKVLAEDETISSYPLEIASDAIEVIPVDQMFE